MCVTYLPCSIHTGLHIKISSVLHTSNSAAYLHTYREPAAAVQFTPVSLSLPRQTPVQTTATSLETLIRFPGPLFLSPSIHISLWLSFSACFQFSGIRFDSIQLSSAPSKDVCWQDQFVLFSVASVIKPIPLLDCLSLFLSLSLSLPRVSFPASLQCLSIDVHAWKPNNRVL